MNKTTIYTSLGLTPQVLKFGEEIEASLKDRFEVIDERAECCQASVLDNDRLKF